MKNIIIFSITIAGLFDYSKLAQVDIKTMKNRLQNKADTNATKTGTIYRATGGIMAIVKRTAARIPGKTMPLFR
jgi:hypothetical protein